MGWFDKWFDETDWPKDPHLDPFRGAVWQLSLNGEVKGWVTTSVTPMRSIHEGWPDLDGGIAPSAMVGGGRVVVLWTDKAMPAAPNFSASLSSRPLPMAFLVQPQASGTAPTSSTDS
jgi:hypothetical protein